MADRRRRRADPQVLRRWSVPRDDRGHAGGGARRSLARSLTAEEGSLPPIDLSNLLTLLGWLAVGQAVLVAAAMGARRPAAHPAVPALVALLLAAAAALGAILLSHRLGEGGLLWVVEAACTALAGPLFYAWVARVLEERRRGRRRHLTIPAAVAGYELLSMGAGSGGRPLPEIPILLLIALQGGYTVAAAVLLARRWKEPEAVARRGPIALLIVLLALVHLASLTRFLTAGQPLLVDLVPAVGILVVYAVSFLALRQPRLLRLVDPPAPASATTVEVEETGAPASAEAPRRYASSPLSDQQVAALRARLVEHLATALPHLRPDLTLPELARELGTLPTHLSRVVNEGGESFPELLARYRVEAAKGLLADPRLDHLTVEALGRRAGFRSRSAFYDAFRRQVGRTPSAFRRDVAASLELLVEPRRPGS
jgi:AraC-like DNA-binding protein